MIYSQQLVEIKYRLKIVLVFFALVFFTTLFFSNRIVERLTELTPANVTFIIDNPFSAFSVLLNVSFFVAAALTLPLLMYHLYRFAEPAINNKEKHFFVKYFPLSIILFFVGVTFNYLGIILKGVPFMAEIGNSMGLTVLWNFNDYLNFVIFSTFIIGLLFQYPLILNFLIKLGYLKVESLKSNRVYVFFVTCIISAIVTPTTDAITMFFIAIPLYIFFEIVLKMNGGAKHGI